MDPGSIKSNITGPLFILHHGAGQSAKTFTLLARSLGVLLPNCEVLAFDSRGHGETKTNNDQDLSLDTLVNDFKDIVESNRIGFKEIILVGHSMGGAVCADLLQRELVKGIMGCVVLDVVEGTAIEALAHMNTILASRPKTFPSLDSAIDWAVSTRQIRNRKSAEISIPSQIFQVEDRYEWIADLKSSSPFWNGWFLDLSNKFLQMKTAKLLVLAGTERLDKTLTIGQMQGKFQMEIVTESGHFIQEDEPDRLAQILHTFYMRNQPLDLNKIKKIGLDKTNSLVA